MSEQNQTGELTADEREEIVEMHVVARPNGGMRWQNPGEPCRSFDAGDVIKVARKNVRWLEASKKAYRDKKKAAEVSEQIRSTFTGNRKRASKKPEADAAATQ